MAKRIFIKTKNGDKIEMHRPLIADDDGSIPWARNPVYGWPEITIEGDFEFEVEELRDYVQVEFVGRASSAPTNKLYTYIDPNLGLEIGDLVDVPSRLADNNLAYVRALGPNDESLADYITKEVNGVYRKVEKEELTNEVNYGSYAQCGPEYGCFCGDQPCGCRDEINW